MNSNDGRQLVTSAHKKVYDSVADEYECAPNYVQRAASKGQSHFASSITTGKRLLELGCAVYDQARFIQHWGDLKKIIILPKAQLKP